MSNKKFGLIELDLNNFFNLTWLKLLLVFIFLVIKDVMKIKNINNDFGKDKKFPVKLNCLDISLAKLLSCGHGTKVALKSVFDSKFLFNCF